MSSPSRPEFGLLDLEGKEYHRWVSDMELAFESRGIEGMFADPPADFPPMAKTQTLIFMRRHIHATLKRQYLNVKDPKELWDKLRLRYNNVHDKLLPELTVRWDNIRLLDYKRVDDFNQDMLCLQSDLGTVGVIKTDLDLLNKTLDTFPINYEVQAHTYRTHVEEGKIRSFADLMALLAKKERHSEILLNNNNRPVGTKRISTPQSNYGKAPKQKNQSRNAPYQHQNNNSRGGRQQGRSRPRSNTWTRDGGGAAPSGGGRTRHTPQGGRAPPKASSSGNGKSPCFKCGSFKHCNRECRARKEMIKAYSAYKKFLQPESHHVDEDHEIETHHISMKPEPLASKARPPVATMDTPDFD